MKISHQDSSVIVFESELMQTTCTLIIRPDHLLLVDPNWLPSEVAFIAREVEKRRTDLPLYLLFTHSDYDHIIAYERFKATAKLIVSQALLDNPEQTLQLEEIRNFYDQYYLQPPWPISYPQNANLVISKRKEIHQVGNSTYHFYQAPGHNPDGLLTYLVEQQVLIVGDYLCAVEFPFIYHSIKAYQQTLKVLDELLHTQPIRLLIGGHGPVTTQKQEMLSRLADAKWYLEQLIAYGDAGILFPEEELWSRYPHFPIIQGKYHRGNMELARKELGGGVPL
ncbi:MAG: MBL fold metallo-hydrolase [Bacteroidota bacterium]